MKTMVKAGNPVAVNKGKEISWFKCFIAGRNFPGVLVNESQPVGFYTTRFAEASSVSGAEEKVLEALRHDARLKLPPNAKLTSDSEILFEEIVEVSEEDVPDEDEGFVWYMME